MSTRIILAFLVIVIFSAGCAEIEAPTPQQLFKDPLAAGALKRGMHKQQVMEIYGKPSETRMVTSPDWNKERQEWVYRANFTALPVGTGYLKDDLYCYFDGDNLTNVSRKPLGKAVEGVTSDAGEYIK